MGGMKWLILIFVMEKGIWEKRVEWNEWEPVRGVWRD